MYTTSNGLSIVLSDGFASALVDSGVREVTFTQGKLGRSYAWVESWESARRRPVDRRPNRVGRQFRDVSSAGRFIHTDSYQTGENAQYCFYVWIFWITVS